VSADQLHPAWLGRLWGFLTSVRLTIFLLLALSWLSILGTIRYDGIYYTVWFLAPLALFALNLSACLVKGLPQAVARVRRPLTLADALALPERGKFTVSGAGNPETRVAAAMRAELGRGLRQERGGEELVFFLERGRWRPLGPYLVHLSLLFILAGGLIGKYLGLEGRVSLMPGEMVRAMHTPAGENPLPFQLRLERFQVWYYADGTPREFRSDLTFTGEDGRTEQVVCRVNEPVTFGGLTFYQSSYGQIVPLRVTLGQDAQEVEAPLGRVMSVLGGKGKIKVLAYEPNLVMPMGGKPQALGPAVRLAYLREGEHARAVWVLKNFPQVSARQSEPYLFEFLDKSLGYFSVLQVKWDPGVWWVYVGFLLLLPGFFLAFARPPQRWAVVLAPRPGGGWQGRLLGAAPRAREAFQARQERLLSRLTAGGGA